MKICNTREKGSPTCLSLCGVCGVCGVCCVCCVCCVLCVLCVLCVQDFWWVSSRFLVGVFKIFGPLRWTPTPPERPLRQSAPSPPPDGPSAGPPKISLFLFLFPAGNLILSSLWGVFSLNLGGVFEDRDPHMCTFGALWLSCENAGVFRAAGASHDNPRTPNAHI